MTSPTLARRVERGLRRAFKRLLRRALPEAREVRPDELDGIRRVLIARPNFRLGNAAIGTAVIDAFHRRFPEAEIDYLGADTTAAVLMGQPIHALHLVSRRFILRPWRIITLVRRLRARHYDLVAQLNAGSVTGILVAGLAGARLRMGRSPEGARWYEVEVPGRNEHAYDNAVNFAHCLGVPPADGPVLALTPQETDGAEEQLAALGIRAAFIAVFIGGHGRKRWPLASWQRLIADLDARGEPFVVFLGPEERHLARALRPQLTASAAGVLVEPRPLREFIAMLSRARCLVTPDSGPMHFAAGLGVPTVTIVMAKVSRRFVPRGPHDRMLLDPSPESVAPAVTAVLEEIPLQPDWPSRADADETRRKSNP